MTATEFIHDVGDQIMANVGLDIDPVPITAWLVLFLTIIAVVTAIVAAVKKINDRFEQRIGLLIEERTHPIQPDANGGFSLSDANKKLDAMKDRVDEMDDRYSKMFDDVAAQRKEWRKTYVNDQQRTHKERASIFKAIRKMIRLTPDEQADAWDDIIEQVGNGTITTEYPEEKE